MRFLNGYNKVSKEDEGIERYLQGKIDSIDDTLYIMDHY